MANENKTVKNFVKLEGWLKDNTLAESVTSNQKNAISGQLIIATSAMEEYRIRLFAAESFNNGTKNPNYENLKKMLPAYTVTIKTILEGTEGAIFEQAITQASKVWATGSLSIYDRKDEQGQIHTSITLQGNRAGFKIDGPLTKKAFAPCATFDVEGYVTNMVDEIENDTETGRMKVTLMVPDYYHETAMPIEFFAEGDAVGLLAQHYQMGDTGYFSGTLRNARKEVKSERAPAQFLDGTTEEIAPTYVFVNERIIRKMTAPYLDGDVKKISSEEVHSLVVNREKMLEELEVAADKGGSSSANFLAPTTSASAAPAASSKGFEL